MNENSRSKTVFDSIDLGTTVTTSTMDDFYVTVDPTIMMHDYADALLHDLNRRNPLKYEQSVKLFGSDIFQAAHDYVDGLVAMRIQSIEGNCPVWRKAKLLAMTAVVQDALSCLGVIIDRAHGYRIIPKLKFDVEYDVDKMLMFSSFVENFQSDGLKLFVDALPRSIYGDADVMSCVIIQDEVKSFKIDAHPSFSYISSFLGLEPGEGNSLRYDVRYDLLSYIKFMLLSEVRKCSF